MASFHHRNHVISLVQFVLTLATALGKGTAPHDIDCKDAPNGLHEIGCWGYADCMDGKPIVHNCDVDLVFDRASMTCVKPGTTQTDCFLPVDCNGMPDRSYPDYTDSCVTYYRCYNEKNLGRFYCPAQTAFNENLQICDYPQNLPPPCGSKIDPNFPMTPVPKRTTTQKMTTTQPTTQKMTTTTQSTTTTTVKMTTQQPTVTTTQNMMTSQAPTVTTTTTQKPMQTSQLHVILTSGSPKPTVQTTTSSMPTSTT